jgi:hypothetical protein
MFSKIAGTGGYLPAQVLTNDERRGASTSATNGSGRGRVSASGIAAAEEQQRSGPTPAARQGAGGPRAGGAGVDI